MIRLGLRGSRPGLILTGMLMLGCYGLAVNQVRWDFGRLLGVYVAIFAAVSILAGRLVFGDQILPSTWARRPVDGMQGGTGASPDLLLEHTGIPTLAVRL